MVLVWGVKRVVPVLVTSLSFTEEAFDPRLQPIRVKASIECKVLTSSDLPLQHVGGTLYIAYRQAVEQLAAHGHQLGRATARAGAPAVSVSRYANVGQALWTAPDGRQVPYLLRRLLPAPGTLATSGLHQVQLGRADRHDRRLGARRPELSWLLGDANLAMRPTELAQAGHTLVIPLPAGVPGPAMASELTLSLMMGLGVDPVPRAVMEALTEVSVRIGAGGPTPSGFELKFATSKLSQITTQLLPSGYFDPPTRVVIAATLRGVDDGADGRRDHPAGRRAER